jgi:RHS repeat-associated protein
VKYGYDAASNRMSMTDPQNLGTAYTYDVLNRLFTLAFNGQTPVFQFGYDALSRRTSLTRPNGVNTTYAYDPASSLTSVLHKLGTTTLDGATYTYDAAENRKTRTDKRLNTTLTYTYDNIYELLFAKQGATTKESYTYDPVGNRKTSLGVNPYLYNTSNELQSTPSTSYTYDNNGNLKTKSDGTQYNWDFENRLTSVVLPGAGGTVSFKYDGFGRRAQKSFTQGASTTTTDYLYDGANMFEEVDSSGNVLARYTELSRELDQPLSMLRSGAPSYFEQDGLLSTTSLTSASGAIANTYSYDSYGKLTASTGTLTNPFRYAGREFDQETGSYYNRARYYDQNIGRFISEDPIGFQGGVNFYRYAGNDVTNAIDPLGLQPQSCGCSGPYEPYPGYAGPYQGNIPNGALPWNEPFGPNTVAAYGDATGGPFNNNLANVSRSFGNNAWSNCVRGCLLSAWDPCKKKYIPNFYYAHAVCYRACTLGLVVEGFYTGLQMTANVPFHP